MTKPEQNESKQDFLTRCMGEAGGDPGQAFAACNREWGESQLALRDIEADRLKLGGRLELTLSPEAEARPSFAIAAYTGAVVDLGWFGRFVIDLAGIQAKKKIPVLREHKRDRVVGIADKIWADSAGLYATGKFSAITPDAAEVLALAREGYPWQASIGVNGTRIEYVERGASAEVNGTSVDGPIEIWRLSEVGEISFVSLGADDETAAIALAGQAGGRRKKEDGMEITLKKLEESNPELLDEIRLQARREGEAKGREAGLSEGLEKGRAEGEAAERGRVTVILEADGDRAVSLAAIKDGVPAGEVGMLLFKAEREKRGQALDRLKASAPQSMGAEEPAVQAGALGPRAEVDHRARAMAEDEGLSLTEARRRVLAEDPELNKRLRKAYKA